MALFGNLFAPRDARSAAKREMAEIAKLVALGVRREMELRGYDAARTTRSTWSWLAGGTSANAEVYAGLLTLRNRTRDLVRNNPHASKAVRVIVNNAIGTGITAMARTPSETLNKTINEAWKIFVEECDYVGQHDLGGLQRLAMRSMVEGGETIARLRTVKTASRFAVPLELQLLEGDFLDHRKNERAGDGKIAQGIQFDAEDKRKAYWLFKEHPGEMPFVIPQSYVSAPVPAAQILHLYEVLRIGQIRGTPWLTPGVMKSRELDTYEEAELVRKRIEACVAAIVVGADDESQEGIVPSVTDGAGNKVEQFEPGLIAIARGSKDVKFTQPASNGMYHEYKRSQLQSLAAAWDMTYELLSGDLSKVNYSSIQAGINEFRRSMEVLQWLTFIPMFCRPVWKAFIDRGIASGLFPENCPYDHEFTSPQFEPVDKVKENDGDIAAVRALLMPPQEAIRRRGFDPDTVLADTKAWHEKLVKAGLVSDADAAQVGKVSAPAVNPPPGASGDK